MDIADLIVLIQELEIDEPTRRRLIESVSTKGLTEADKREIQGILVQHIDRDYKGLTAYQAIEDLLIARDNELETVKKETEQALGRVTMKADAQLSSLERKIDEDISAASGGATLLLHSDDVAPLAVRDQPVAPAVSTAPSPKDAARVVVNATKVSAAPAAQVDDSVPATLAPLPATPIAPPAITEPTAA